MIKKPVLPSKKLKNVSFSQDIFEYSGYASDRWFSSYRMPITHIKKDVSSSINTEIITRFIQKILNKVFSL